MSDGSIHSDCGHGIAAGVGEEAEEVVATLARSHDHLVHAVTMARITVFAIGRDRKVTIVVAAPSYPGRGREKAKLVLSRLIPTPDIQPFLDRLESVLNGHAIEASQKCEIDGHQYLAHFQGRLTGSNLDSATGIVIGPTPLTGDAQPNREDNHRGTAVNEAAAGLGRDDQGIATRQLQSQLSRAITMVDHISSDKQLRAQGGILEQQMEALTHALSTILHDISSTPRHIRFHVVTIIQGVALKSRPLAESKGLRLNCKIPIAALTGLEVVGDPIRLEQLLTILLRNGLRATRQGGVLFEVTKQPSVPGHVNLTFEVVDTGRETEGPVETTGLGWIHHDFGLAMSLAEAMDARMSVYSTPGAGTTSTVTIRFNVSVPVLSEPHPPPRKHRSKIPSREGSVAPQ